MGRQNGLAVAATWQTHSEAAQHDQYAAFSLMLGNTFKFNSATNLFSLLAHCVTHNAVFSICD
jgi:hypothetical protein